MRVQRTARRRRGAVVAGAFPLFLVLAAAAAAGAERRVLDDFSDPARWRAAPAAGVALTLAAERGERGAALRLDFDFQGHGGYAVAHRDLPLELPANWELSFRLRGER